MLLLLLLVLVGLGVGQKEEEARKMRVKELKARLEERGVRSDDLLDKKALVARVLETWDMPVIAKKEEEKQPPPDVDLDEVLASFKKKQKEQSKLEEMLKAQGIDTSNMHFGGQSAGMEKLIADLERKRKQQQQKKKKEEL